MLHNQFPVRRWKQWLALPMLGGLFFAASQVATAQTTPSPRPETEAVRQARHAVIKRKTRAAMHQDSLRTGGKFEPGTAQQVNITNMQGKPEDVDVSVTRIKVPMPTIVVNKGVAGQAPAVPAPPIAYSKEAPAPATSTDKAVYTYVEQMPALPGGGGMGAIIQQIQQNFVYPSGPHQEGRMFASFTVRADGSVGDTKIIKSIAPAYDEAVLAAIQKLPRFVPGKQGGRPVAVSFTVPVTFKEKP